MISAIIPVHNGETFLSRALRSVLSQSCVETEIIVVDDGSTDGSSDVARRFHSVECLRTEHLGQASALNHGVARARGELLAFLDADDEWLPSKLELQTQAMASDPTLDIVFGHAEQVLDAPGALQVEPRALPARLPSAMLIRRSALLRAGPFDVQLGLGMVVEWYARARDSGLREIMLDAVLYRRWIHGENTGIRRAAARSEYATALRAVLERRRAGHS